MPNVVFDASTVVGAAMKADSIPERALRSARKYWTLCLSQAVEDEIREVLSRPKLRRYVNDRRRQLVLDLLLPRALAIEPTVRVNDCRDAKDNKYLELALAAGAAVIVSSDNDLLALSPWRGVRIVTPAAFVAEFEAGSEPTSPGSNPAS
jgi:putative PIN family toxin of toxin-antitoxin system